MKTNDFSPDRFFENVYETVRSPFYGITDAEECAEIIGNIKKKAADVFRIEAIPFRLPTPAVTLLRSQKRKTYTLETLSVQICRELSMLCYALIPDERNGSGIAALCGHGYGARQIIRQSKAGRYRVINFLDDYQKNFAEALALNGHTVIVPEFIGFGEAKLTKDARKPFYASSCDTVSHHSLLFGFSTAGMRIYQTMKCIDLLLERYGCSDIGCMGISGGGLVALYTSLLDERISRACVCGYINTFETSVLSMWHCPDNYVPGLAAIGDMGDFAAALAPRRLMMQCGKKDKLFPIGGSEKAMETIARVYALNGCGERFTPDVFAGKHELDLPAALDFFGRRETK